MKLKELSDVIDKWHKVDIHHDQHITGGTWATLCACAPELMEQNVIKILPQAVQIKGDSAGYAKLAIYLEDASDE